ncbi:chemotaxis protein CheB [Winogradskya humida]|uniref:protein-glutamate methylesterase n=1 Tax=Winogradskya humida TaxID=113566 RepID=A0ABQ3ZV16_9ACTN|nr:chemotaxis protein CheB [Actinoplanes humidus]GIE22408.1 chemotaxis protein CheB [Actinoplanes humidus]
MTAGRRDIVAAGASAGGVEALRALVSGLPSDYAGTLLVVLHLPRNAPTALPAILSRAGALSAAQAVDGESLRPGHIHVAPSDHHLLILEGRIRITRGPAENGHRPAIDPLFRSLARAFGRRAVGVVLSGTRDDGASGLAGIVARGGTAVVQDPAEALYPWMPHAAIAHASPQHIVPAARIGPLLAELAALPCPASVSHASPGLACPACGGPALEGALWIALRALEEKSALSRRMAAGRAERKSSAGTSYSDLAQDAEDAGATIRQLIARLDVG